MSGESPRTIAILGGGNWGTVLAIRLRRAGHDVTMWEFDPERAARVHDRRENEDFLPGIPLPDGLTVTADGPLAVTAADLVFVVLPTPAVRPSLRMLKEHLGHSTVIVSASKGIEQESGARISQIISAETSAEHPVVVLSGPNLAWEVIKGHPSSAVAASTSASAARLVQRLLSDESYRVYTNPDVIGVEYGGALKNIIAIAAGVVNGLGFGDNTKAALMTRGLAEIARFGVHHGANPLTFTGLSGLGDLVTTCASSLSRNHTCGRLLAEGCTLDDIGRRMRQVAEGVNSTRAVKPRAEDAGISMPITVALHGVLFQGHDVAKAVAKLMTRSLRAEDEFTELAKFSSC